MSFSSAVKTVKEPDDADVYRALSLIEMAEKDSKLVAFRKMSFKTPSLLKGMFLQDNLTGLRSEIEKRLPESTDLNPYYTKGKQPDELEKIKRVLKKHNDKSPHETLLVIDGGSGQNAVQQANEFHKSIELSGIAVTKLDGTAKGGVLFAISDSLNLPIRYIGIGEDIDDLKPFHAKDFINALFD